jgi:hypothetical protein
MEAESRQSYWLDRMSKGVHWGQIFGKAMCPTSLARELIKVKLGQVSSWRNHWICFEEARVRGLQGRSNGEGHKDKLGK